MSDTHSHSQSFFNKYVKRAELFTFAFVTLVLVIGGGYIRQSQTIRSDAADSAQTQSSQNVLTIAGYVYVDENQNGHQDSNEKGYPDATIQIMRSRSDLSITPAPTGSFNDDVVPLYRTDSNGYFKYQVPSGGLTNSTNYTVLLFVPFGYKATSKNPIIFKKLHKRADKNIEFGIMATEVVVPTQSCNRVELTNIKLGESCANSSDSYKSVTYTCSDGYFAQIGEQTSCKSYDVWKAIAHENCKVRSCQATPPPSPSCIPEALPVCIDPDGPCSIVVPPTGGWCPKITPGIDPTCIPFPPCALPGANPQCLLRPAPGTIYCPYPSLSPTIIVDECTWCGNGCVDGPLPYGRMCPMVMPDTGLSCKRINGKCSVVKLSPSPIAPIEYRLSGTVFIDKNKNAVKDSNEIGYGGIPVTISYANRAIMVVNTDSTGNYSLLIGSGKFSLSIAVPQGYKITTKDPSTSTIPPNAVQNFGIVKK